jgi:hypothetical protein
LTDFVALYRGRTVSEAELVAVSAEPRLVGKFVTELLQKHVGEREETDKANHRPTVVELARREE